MLHSKAPRQQVRWWETYSPRWEGAARKVSLQNKVWMHTKVWMQTQIVTSE